MSNQKIIKAIAGIAAAGMMATCLPVAAFAATGDTYHFSFSNGSSQDLAPGGSMTFPASQYDYGYWITLQGHGGYTYNYYPGDTLPYDAVDQWFTAEGITSCYAAEGNPRSITINYQIEKANAQTIYRTIGQDYYSTVIIPRIQESVKSVIAKYNAESLISSREKLSVEIKSILVEKLAAYNIEVIDASIENLDFSDTYTDAVEAKQVAEQNKLKAQIEQEQAILEAEAAAKRAVIEAEAEAEVKKIDADAKAYAGEKEAEANGKIADSLSPELIEYKYVEKWDGKLPTYVGGEGGTIPILNIGADTGADTDE